MEGVYTRGLYWRLRHEAAGGREGRREGGADARVAMLWPEASSKRKQPQLLDELNAAPLTPSKCAGSSMHQQR